MNPNCPTFLTNILITVTAPNLATIFEIAQKHPYYLLPPHHQHRKEQRCTNFHCVKKLKPIGTAFSHDYYYICRFNHLEKVKGDDGTLLTPPS